MKMRANIWNVLWLFGMIITMALIWPGLLHDKMERRGANRRRYSFQKCALVMLCIYILGFKWITVQ